jgi:hypothetical protein
MSCIICGKADILTLEHIVPESLGNATLSAKFLCKDCNSKIGRIVDIGLTNNGLVESIRRLWKVTGKKGKYPNNMKYGYLPDETEVRITDDFTVTQKPRLKYDDTNPNHFSVFANNTSEAVDMVKRTLERQKIQPEEINRILNEVRNAEPQIIENSKVHFRFNLDLKKLYVAIIKVAYEFAVYSLGLPYCDDCWGNQIKALLVSVIDDKTNMPFLDMVVRFIKMNVEQNINNANGNLTTIDVTKTLPVHGLRLICLDKILIAQIKLFGCPSLKFSIPISFEKDKYDVPNKPTIIYCKTEFPLQPKQKEELHKLIEQDNYRCFFR